MDPVATFNLYCISVKDSNVLHLHFTDSDKDIHVLYLRKLLSKCKQNQTDVLLTAGFPVTVQYYPTLRTVGDVPHFTE